MNLVHRKLRAASGLLLLLVVLPALTLGQDSSSLRLASIPRGLPADVFRQVQAVGTRMRSPGREETVLDGVLTVGGEAPKTVRVVQQLSGMVRVDGRRERVPLRFDGDLARGNTDRVDDGLLETFVTDTIEGMVYSVRSGAAVRLLGRGFGPDPRTVSDYTGPRYDIFEITARVRTRPNTGLLLKRYYFDSETGLLVSTRYVDPTLSPVAKVETRFSDWQQADGSAYPGRIERYEAGALVFTFTATAAIGRTRQETAAFR